MFLEAGYRYVSEAKKVSRDRLEQYEVRTILDSYWAIHLVLLLSLLFGYTVGSLRGQGVEIHFED